MKGQGVFTVTGFTIINGVSENEKPRQFEEKLFKQMLIHRLKIEQWGSLHRELAREIIDQLLKGKLVLLDKMLPGVTGEYAAAYEDFDNDIYGSWNRRLLN